jgi:sterol 3beta-glucosyltransferase
MSSARAHPDGGGKRRLSQKIRAASQSLHRLPASRIPDRFKDDDDAQEDVTAPPRDANGRDVQYMNQSIFSMIAAAGSRSDFHSRFDDSSDSDGGDVEKAPKEDTLRQLGSKSNPRRGGNTPTVAEPILEESDRYAKAAERGGADERGRGHRRRISDSKLLRSMPKIASLKPGKQRRLADKSEPLSDEPSLSPSPARLSGNMTPRSAPVLSRMIEAQNSYDPTIPSTEESGATEKGDAEKTTDQPTPTSLLSTRLKEIFGFDKPERVIAEYPCWLMQSAALQGYMYVTEGHVCFYAYLPLKSNTAVKSGYLAKRGRKNPKYNRYWFSLKGDVFSYYADPSKLYFPSGHVDLRYGISASLSEKEKGKDVKDFTVTTDHRSYHFRADSATSAKEWVKALQKVIFRSQNEGGRVKISLPIENIIDIEESPMIDLAETFKIRVVDIYETYAIDEVSLLQSPRHYIFF